VSLAEGERLSEGSSQTPRGQPAIAEAFKLTHLRPRYGSGATTPDEPAGDEPTTEPGDTAEPGAPPLTRRPVRPRRVITS
jgi:hypothetical protein